MFGLRGLYNFNWMDPVSVDDFEVGRGVREGGKGQGEGERVEEEEMMEGAPGLRGRFSAGGEVYFSAIQRSFGSTYHDILSTHLGFDIFFRLC